MVDEGTPRLTFPFEVEYPFAHVGRLFAVRPEQACLEIEGEEVTARFGPWSVVTSIDNIEAAQVTGPYSPWKVVGPAHVSLADGGLTFATTTRQGLCLRFREAVTGALPLPLPRHGSLTVTVQEPERVADVIERLRRAERRSADEQKDDALAQTAHDVLVGSTASELRAQAELRGLEHASRASKAELVEELSSTDYSTRAPGDESEQPPSGDDRP
jgi:hypothetical protein